MADSITIKDIDITYLGHSGFVVSGKDFAFAIDPFLTGAPMAVKKPEDIKVGDIFLTHGHADHIGDAIQIAQQNDAVITAGFETAEYCRILGAKTSGIPVGGTLQYPFGSAHFRYAMHSGLLPDGKPFGQAASILFRLNGLTLYALGDTALHQDFKLVGSLYRPDIAFIPIGGRANMNIDEALIAAQWLGAPTVVPIHYDLYTQGNVDPLDFKKRLEENSDTRCLILKP